jgi:hypothetical protein
MGNDGLLYASGDDRAEIYVLALPDAGSELIHVTTIPVATGGQAIGFDQTDPRTLWTIDRGRKELVASRLPPVGGNRHRAREVGGPDEAPQSGVTGREGM